MCGLGWGVALFSSTVTPAASAEHLKRRFYLVLLSVLVVSSFASLLLFTQDYFFDRVLSPALLLILAGLTTWLWWQPTSLKAVERGVTLAAALSYALILAHTLYLSSEEGARAAFLDIFRLWGPLIYLWSYLALGKRRGLAASLAFYAATLLVSLPYFLFYPLADAAFGGRYLLGDFYLASLAYIAGLHVFATFLEWQVAERLAAEALTHYAYTDPLTELPNRRYLAEALERSLERQDGRLLGVLFVDLDEFKAVNDRWGHQAGDALLVAVAARLKTCVRLEDTVARLGGDEFAVVLPDLKDKEDAAKIARGVVTALAVPFELSGGVASVTASVGVSLYPQDGTSAEGLLLRADRAMYRVKAGGKNGYCEDVRYEDVRCEDANGVRLPALAGA